MTNPKESTMNETCDQCGDEIDDEFVWNSALLDPDLINGWFCSQVCLVVHNLNELERECLPEVAAALQALA